MVGNQVFEQLMPDDDVSRAFMFPDDADRSSISKILGLKTILA